jgi:hypothetical protein
MGEDMGGRRILKRGGKPAAIDTAALMAEVAKARSATGRSGGEPFRLKARVLRADCGSSAAMDGGETPPSAWATIDFGRQYPQLPPFDEPIFEVRQSRVACFYVSIN